MSLWNDRLEHLRWLTRVYPGMQGLRILPIGLFIVVMGIQRLDLIPFLGRQGNCSVTLPLLLVSFGLWYWLGRYYMNRFGRVEPIQGWWSSPTGSLLQIIALVGIVVLENVLYRAAVSLPVSLIELVAGLSFFWTGLTTRRHYYTIAGVLFSGLSFLPGITGKGLGDPLVGSLGLVFTLAFGLGILIIGLIDHFYLERAFRQSEGSVHG